jgi:DNA-directed RNA polymerase subunit H
VREQLPKIRDSDPAAKVVGAKAGSIVRITRRSPTAGVAVAYRLVVEAI